MKLRARSLISLLLSFIILITVPVFAGAAENTSSDNQTQVTEITIKSSEIKSKGAFKAIQSALNSAHYGATKDNVYKIIVEAGSYELRSALHVYSNTTLSLYNVTLTRSKESICNMIRTGDDTAVNKGGTGYSPNSNITIEGGTLNGGGTSNTVIKVTHASQFRMIGTEVTNVKNAHIMEVAAVDGFTVKNCSFKNQTLDADKVGYEAIQLDIPKDGHIVGCRSEALNNRNVQIEGCYFTNCPRAIGSHTQILNLPMENIVIRDNTFKDLKSAAIQAENWKDCEITNNRIEGTPRAIAIYSVLGENGGGFKSGVLAKEGKTENTVSEAYQTPFDSNIIISDNTIKDCGAVKDIYAGYKPLAILVMGKNITKKQKTFSDGSGGYPKGDYYISGVTIKNNIIETAGHGIFLQDVRSSSISGNTISCVKNDIISSGFNPITTLESTLSDISGNTISSAPYHGMELASTTIKSIVNNTVSNVGGSGIILEAKAKVTSGISENTITKAATYGINIRPNSAAGKISGNIIYNCGKKAIQQEKKATAEIGSNYYEIAKMAKLSLGYTKLTLGEEESFTLTPTYSPANSIAKFSWSSADSTVAGVSQNGKITAHQYGETDITVKSESGKTASCHIKVLPPPSSIKLSEKMLTVGVGESVSLNAKLPDGTFSQSVKYRSNNTDAVTVDSKGKITAHNTGTATIVAETFNGKHACCNVIVKYEPYDIWFNSGEMSMGVGETASLRLIIPDSTASHAAVWKSDNEAVATVDQKGEIKAKAAGEATVTCTAYNGTIAICKLTVTKEPISVSFGKSEYTAAAGDSFTPEVLFSEGTVSHALSFQSSDPDICRINRETGEVTARSAGTVTLTVKTYNRLSATCTVVISDTK